MVDKGIELSFKDIVLKKGGRIWPTTLGFTAGGTGTASTDLSTSYRTPDAARTLLGWRPIDYPLAAAVAQGVMGRFEIRGSNYKWQPQQVMAGTVANSYLSVGGNLQAPSEYYDVFAPVNGGETWTLTFVPYQSVAGNRRTNIEFTWTDVRVPEIPVIFSQMDSATTFTAAGVTAGNAININNAHKLIEVVAGFVQLTQVAGQLSFIESVVRSTVLQPVQEIRNLGDPAGPAGTTSGGGMAYLSRKRVWLDFTADRATVTQDYNNDQLTTNAVSAVWGIRWI